VVDQPRQRTQAFLYAFDLLELDGTDLRGEPPEVRKATLASILRKSRFGISLNEHLEHDSRINGFPARLPARVRGHRLRAAGIARPVRPFTRLAQVQEPAGTSRWA
jgi:hypothetical protein